MFACSRNTGTGSTQSRPIHTMEIPAINLKVRLLVDAVEVFAQTNFGSQFTAEVRPATGHVCKGE